MCKLFRVFLVLTMSLMISGCGGDSLKDFPKDPISLVIIAGKHANSNNFSDSMIEQTRELIEQSIKVEKDGISYYSGAADVTLIVSDGKPRTEKISIGNGSKLETEGNNKTVFKENLSAMIDAIVDKLISDDVKAKEQGCDLQAALNQAKKVLNKKDTLNKHILILDSGICTEGYLDMRKLNFADEEASEILDKIDSSAFINLEGIEVTFLGLGNVAEPQPELSESSEAEQKLIDFWTSFLEQKCNATLTEEIVYENIEGDPLYYNEELEDSYPYVPIVPFNDEENDKFGAFGIPAAEIGFKPNSAELKNASAAKKVLREYSVILKEYFEYYPNKTIYIVGSIARISADEQPTSDNEISLKRAEKIFEILTSTDFGFKKSQFKVIDAGTTKFSWRNHDEFPGGKLNPANQEANRLVELIPETYKEYVKELKEAGEL